ncbi:MAG: S8 family serine peptidase [Thermoleophilia bacterium]
MPHHAPAEGERPLRDARRTRRAAAAWALTVLSLSATVQSASAAERSDSVLVRVDPGAPAAERAEVRSALDADGVRPLVDGWRAYALPADVTLAQAERLLRDEPAVRDVELDGRLHPAEIPDDAYYGSQWALPLIGAPSSWDATGGAGQVVVAVIDTGVQTAHPDLSARLWQNPGEVANGLDDDGNGRVDDVHGWNFYDDNSTLYSAIDGDSHGTHVAGTIAATRGNASGVAGVSHNARIMPLKFLKPGGGYTSDAIVAIQYATAEGADIINASWGGESYSQPLCDAIAIAGDAGVLFVAAAGNGGDDGIGDDNDVVGNWPTNCPATNIVAVAATTPSDGLASFSNYGAAQVDIGAPGEDILSTVPTSAYGWKSGTSMAAPHVSGVAAVVLGMHPALAPWQLRAALTGGGDPVLALAGRTTSGRRLSMSGALTVAGTGIGPDTTPPDAFSTIAPADGHATASRAPLVFSWSPTGDAGSGVASYALMLNGRQVAGTGPSSRSAAYSVEDGAHSWAVVARDASGNARSTPPRTLTVDRTPPSAPVPQSPAAAGRVPGPAVDLSWGASQDALTGVASYRVLVDGVAVATVPGTATSARVTMNRGTHTWQVVAVDGLGNQSQSGARAVTVTPSIPALGTTPGSRKLTLVAPARLASGATPALRVRVPAAMAVRVTVRRADRVKPIGSFRVRARRGLTTIRFPRAVTARMRARGTYVISARATAALRDTVRITVGPRRR